ncbi:hypothetical protein ACIQ9P_28815 [Kitasatospora sp. NPDC094019]|uniref:hypothetical protein n=1 Tax=Kitasatospora sp. NPDC094019 TaxID=3364091 RepID=UPI0038095F30
MNPRRLAAAAATAAVLAPLLALTAATAHAATDPATLPGPIRVQAPAPGFTTIPPNATQPQFVRNGQCMAAYNVNYWVGGMPFALTQLKICLSAQSSLAHGAQIFFPGDVNFLPADGVLGTPSPVFP